MRDHSKKSQGTGVIVPPATPDIPTLNPSDESDHVEELVHDMVSAIHIKEPPRTVVFMVTWLERPYIRYLLLGLCGLLASAGISEIAIGWMSSQDTSVWDGLSKFFTLALLFILGWLAQLLIQVFQNNRDLRYQIARRKEGLQRIGSASTTLTKERDQLMRDLELQQQLTKEKEQQIERLQQLLDNLNDPELASTLLSELRDTSDPNEHHDPKMVEKLLGFAALKEENRDLQQQVQEAGEQLQRLLGHLSGLSSLMDRMGQHDNKTLAQHLKTQEISNEDLTELQNLVEESEVLSQQHDTIARVEKAIQKIQKLNTRIRAQASEGAPAKANMFAEAKSGEQATASPNNPAADAGAGASQSGASS